MNADRLVAHYEKIANAPDAIVRLRRFILDLAVRGKLVPQDPNDEPAAELLKRIATEKERLVKAGQIKATKATPALPETPFTIPGIWRWSQLAEIGLLSPRNEAPDTLEASFVPMPLIAAEYGIVNEHEVRAWGEIKKGYTHFAEGDVGLAKITPCFENGKSTVFRNLTGGVGSGTTELHIVRPLFVDQDYILLFLKSPHFIETGIPKMTGTAGQKRVPTEYFAHSPFPLPPLAEQRRIVAKVGALMALCDRLEAARRSREAVRDRLAAASLARLSAPDPETFQTAARFALDALRALTTRPDQIKQLRQTILNLAVRGKLVPQDPTDEPAIIFDRAIPDDLERPFDIPRSWNWSRLHALGKLKGGGTPSKARDDFWNGSIPWVSPKDMKIDYMAEAQMSISEAAIAGSAANLIETGSVLFVVRGMILAHSFPVAISRAPLAINQDMKALVLKKPAMAEYILRALKGVKPEMLKRVQRSSHGTCRLEGSDYSDFLIPIPPLAEQYRIVAKVDALMALCDRLEASLTAAATTRRRLLDALLAEALAPVDAREMEAAE
jgi:type I restriction enzyme S subunit